MSMLTKTICKLKKVNGNRREKIERHQRRMERLQQQESEMKEFVGKLEAWEPFLKSKQLLDFMLDVVTRGNRSKAELAKQIIKEALVDFENGTCTVEEFVDVIEGKKNTSVFYTYKRKSMYIYTFCFRFIF